MISSIVKFSSSLSGQYFLAMRLDYLAHCTVGLVLFYLLRTLVKCSPWQVLVIVLMVALSKEAFDFHYISYRISPASFTESCLDTLFTILPTLAVLTTDNLKQKFFSTMPKGTRLETN